MPSLTPSTGLTITNPLVLYRALLATKRIDPDPAQHRLALHLQKLYYRLKDYQPEVDYSHRINQLNRLIKVQVSTPPGAENEVVENVKHSEGIFAPFQRQKDKREAKSLTKRLTSHESAIQLQSPQGLLLYGEVGTGKSLLVDLLADCLPNRKKRRWHFNTFMLETFARLEQLRRLRARKPLSGTQDEENSLVWLARDMISKSPIIFLDEFQLPDRAASKILSNLLTSFFHLGGVLIATSNRMPEELANASGVEFGAPPSSRLGLLGNRWGSLGSAKDSGGRSENMFSGKGDFAAFLEVIKARCETWDMEGGKDWRRREVEELEEAESAQASGSIPPDTEGFRSLQPMAAGNWGLGYGQSQDMKTRAHASFAKPSPTRKLYPKHYSVSPPAEASVEQLEEIQRTFKAAELRSVYGTSDVTTDIPWETTVIRVYGRSLIVHRHCTSVTKWTFAQLCSANLGPADYITLASTFHTFILTDVPILTLLQKNEARRLITLLDALYEARCKLLISAEAGPDDIFFPETQVTGSAADNGPSRPTTDDSILPETFSEIYQDSTSPFRPNISSYSPTASPPSYASSDLPTSSSQLSPTRSILADEDSDFGPVYGSDRRSHGPSDGIPGAGNEIGRQNGPDSSRGGIFTGEDEKFAYKRARSRLWEMCGKRWWERDGDWWRPLGREMRRWEGGAASVESVPVVDVGVEELRDEALFKHGASPFRTSQEPPPKLSWVHAWGMMKWGPKAGVWGKGTEGHSERNTNKKVEGKERGDADD